MNLARMLAKEAAADFVITSTGFSKGGAAMQDVALMRKTMGSAMRESKQPGQTESAQVHAFSLYRAISPQFHRTFRIDL